MVIAWSSRDGALLSGTGVGEEKPLLQRRGIGGKHRSTALQSIYTVPAVVVPLELLVPES